MLPEQDKPITRVTQICLILNSVKHGDHDMIAIISAVVILTDIQYVPLLLVLELLHGPPFTIMSPLSHRHVTIISPMIPIVTVIVQ